MKSTGLNVVRLNKGGHTRYPALCVAFFVAVALSSDANLISGPRNLWADCTDYGLHMHWLGGNPSVGTGGAERDLTISGTMAYVAAATNRLQLTNISDPAAPVLVSSIALNNGATGVAQTTGVTVVGSKAYVTNAYKGLFIVDVSNPGSPAVLGSVDTPGVAEDVAVSGNFAYVADYSSGLQVINITNPAAPVIIGSVDTPGNAFGVALFGSIAYVADEFVGVHVIDVSNPSAPIIRGTVSNPGTPQVPGNAQDLVAAGSTVYVADGKQGFLVINASSPSAPALVGSVDTPGYAWDLSVQGTRAYVADDTGGLSIIDIANPALPIIVATKQAAIRAVAVSGTIAFALDGYGLRTINVSNLIPVPVVGSLHRDFTPAPSPIDISGSLICVAEDTDLVTVDVSNPSSPQVLGRVHTPGRVQDLGVSGSTGYVTFAGTVPPTGPDFGGLLVIDLSIPASPQIIGRLDLAPPGSFAVSGTLLFVALSGWFPDGTRATNGFWVVDVSDPHHPALMGGETPSYPPIPWGVINRAGTLAYVSRSDGVGGHIDVVNVANPASPTVIGVIDFAGWNSVGRIKISGIYGYAPLSRQSVLPNGGVAVMQMSPFPEAPRLLSIAYLLGVPRGLAVQGSMVYVADDGVYVIDASNPTAPTIVGSSDVLASNTLVSGSLLYARSSDLTILPTHCYASTSVQPDSPPLHSVLEAAFPNPGRTGSTFIPFTVSKFGAVKLRIFDASGRQVRTLVNDMMETGERKVEWDGRNSRGELVPAGIYVYELNAPGIKAARKLVRLR